MDTGAGLERLAAAIQGCYNNFESDFFSDIINQIESISGRVESKLIASMRVVADHVRASNAPY